MWGGSLTRVIPFFVQVILGVAVGEGIMPNYKAAGSPQPH